jgi:TonB family protein
MKTCALALAAILLQTLCWAREPGGDSLPRIVTFVAPGYPRVASDARFAGTAIIRLTVARDGRVTEANLISGHPLFAKPVIEAVKQWKFASSDRDYTFEVTFRFEFYDPDKCFRPDGTPTTPETTVSATLPKDVLVRTTSRCFITSSSDPVVK